MSKARESREMEMREEFDMMYVSPFSIDKIREEGKSYRWVRTGIKGQEDWRFDEAERQGWEAVPSSRSPFKATDALKRKRYNDFITYKDTILMERPERYCKAEMLRDSQIRYNTIRNLRGVSNDSNNISLVRNAR